MVAEYSEPIPVWALEFWHRAGGSTAEERRACFLVFARYAVRLANFQQASRQEVGAALAPGWSDEDICASGDMAIATSLARELAVCGFEDEIEAEQAWHQMCAILRKYW